MKDMQAQPLNRHEKELLRYFRELSPQNQLDLLGAAEASYNAEERMKALSDRQIERHPEESGKWH